MTQSLTGSWTKEITAGYAPPASEETGIRYPCPQRVLEIERDLLEATPWLLEVAGCFQPGDGNLIYELISVMDAYFGEYYRPHKAAMHRLLRAAKIMEERDSVLAGARRQLVEEHTEVD